VQLAVPEAKAPFLAIDQLVLVASAPVTPALLRIISPCACATAADAISSISSIAALARQVNARARARRMKPWLASTGIRHGFRRGVRHRTRDKNRRIGTPCSLPPYPVR